MAESTGKHPDDQVDRTTSGTPQGGVISPVLANIYLHYVLDLWFEKQVKPSVGGRCMLIRYADDFVITGSSKELLENEVKPLIEKFLAVRGLKLSVEKTQVTPINHGFDFLPQHSASSQTSATRLNNEFIRGLQRHIGLGSPVVLGWPHPYGLRLAPAVDVFHQRLKFGFIAPFRQSVTAHIIAYLRRFQLKREGATHHPLRNIVSCIFQPLFE